MPDIHAVASADETARPVPVALKPEHFDFACWTTLIQDALAEPSATLSNFKITRLHYLLANALRQTIGEEAGANFHTWAVWGSRKAGVTIRQEDRDQASRDGTMVGGIVGAIVGLGIGALLHGWIAWYAIFAWTLVGGICGGLTGRLIILRSRRVAAQLILHGNRIVLDDIGRQSARFIATFRDAREPDAKQLERFLADFRPGHSEADGQDLLKQAFALYWRAKYAADVKEKHEAAYFANCLAVLHEHYRLQPYIKGSLPWIISKCVTQRLMQFDIGPVRLAVSHDVPSLAELPFPSTLMDLRDRDLVEFLHGPNGWDKAGIALAGTAAQDWTQIRERMRYIVNLFRVLHVSPTVWEPPFSDEFLQDIADGRIPSEGKRSHSEDEKKTGPDD